MEPHLFLTASARPYAISKIEYILQHMLFLSQCICVIYGRAYCPSHCSLALLSLQRYSLISELKFAQLSCLHTTFCLQHFELRRHPV